jgi:hypothetical protein
MTKIGKKTGFLVTKNHAIRQKKRFFKKYQKMIDSVNS